jgi:hypothetical protein
MTANIADSPLNRKKINAAILWIMPASFVNMPTPIMPIAVKTNVTVNTVKLKARCRKKAPMINSNPIRNTDELKIIEEGPTPRSLM